MKYILIIFDKRKTRCILCNSYDYLINYISSHSLVCYEVYRLEDLNYLF